jgi:hypothetical protein
VAAIPHLLQEVEGILSLLLLDLPYFVLNEVDINATLFSLFIGAVPFLRILWLCTTLHGKVRIAVIGHGRLKSATTLNHLIESHLAASLCLLNFLVDHPLQIKWRQHGLTVLLVCLKLDLGHIPLSQLALIGKVDLARTRLVLNQNVRVVHCIVEVFELHCASLE